MVRPPELAHLIEVGTMMRAGDNPKRSVRGGEGIEIEDKLYAVLMVAVGIRMPRRVADMAIAGGIDAEDVRSTERLGDGDNSAVFEQGREERGVRFHQVGVVHLRAVKGRMTILTLKPDFKLAAQRVHFGGVKQTTQQHESERIKVLSLLLR